MNGPASRKRNFTQEQKLAFVDAANPHQWFYTAENLHNQAYALWSNRGRSQTTLSQSGRASVTWDDTNRGTFLLAAFAMENMLKAFLVYENPSSISDGYLKEITTHDLWRLANRSSLIPYKDRDRWVFEALSLGNESWARYPCGRNADDIQPEGQFTKKLWEKYCAMMRAYANKIKKLLSKGWDGPYGYYGRWIFTD
ncbi:hypothetical protein H7H48_05530 [Nitratireductor sp. B36]|uniref:hypothetical protein n=1 Tax=Nitratireductor sp. B36 TaxID=2762059 RepID=UPI001E2AC4CA|nr:hypothetical protein [Nitratireductor sp. B36]MCC5778503.1 hypothetical protein [Nitratireductor sp. B36]